MWETPFFNWLWQVSVAVQLPGHVKIRGRQGAQITVTLEMLITLLLFQKCVSKWQPVALISTLISILYQNSNGSKYTLLTNKHKKEYCTSDRTIYMLYKYINNIFPSVYLTHSSANMPPSKKPKSRRTAGISACLYSNSEGGTTMAKLPESLSVSLTVKRGGHANKEAVAQLANIWGLKANVLLRAEYTVGFT